MPDHNALLAYANVSAEHEQATRALAHAANDIVARICQDIGCPGREKVAS